MFFFPYRADLELLKIPLLTILVCIVCIAVYWQQAKNQELVASATKSFCQQPSPRMYRMVIKKATGVPASQACSRLMFEIRRAADPEQFLRKEVIRETRFAGYSATQSTDYMLQIIMTEFQRFDAATPSFLTAKLWYQPDSFNITNMLSAAIAHGSWTHLIGNLFFFFAFAATVEIILGWWKFLLLITLAVGTHLAYSLTSLGVETPVPTVGLSGVVMGMMGMFAWFLPRHGIRCFFWFFIFFRRFSLPAWLLFTWYLGWDIYALTQGDNGGVNLVAHVSGTLIGYAAGMLFLRARKREIVDLNPTP